MKTAVHYPWWFVTLAVTILMAAFLAAIFFFPKTTHGAFGDCPSGYRFDPRSGVGCVQADCGSIPSAHYSYEGYCVCGSSGSINENPNDPNKECGYPSEHASCPGCVYACVGLQEECPPSPGAPPREPILEVPATPEPIAPPGVPDLGSTEVAVPLEATQTLGADEVGTGLPTLSALADAAPTVTPTCTDHCGRLYGGKQGVEILESTGTHPNCRCVVDYKDDLNRIVKNVVLDGDKRTTMNFDPETGALKDRETVSLDAEREAIRDRLGYKYTEEEIDRLLEPGRVDEWFRSRMANIETRTNFLNPYFWSQHLLALFDHGFENDADFVDTHHYGRCGDSMLWLERELSGDLGLPNEPGKKVEAMISITGEKYGNTLNHTALIIRPSGITNDDWSELVKRLQSESGKEDGLTEAGIKHIDPLLLDAKVLDPYYRSVRTVREFIKGWSVIRMS